MINRDEFAWPRRHVLTGRQRAFPFDLPTDEATLLRHYTLADDDLGHIRERRRPENRMGFALQLCALRYPGRLLAPDEAIPEAISRFIGAQLGIRGDALLACAERRQTRQQHLEGVPTRKCSDCPVRVNIPGTQGASIGACHVTVREDWTSLGPDYLSRGIPQEIEPL